MKSLSLQILIQHLVGARHYSGNLKIQNYVVAFISLQDFTIEWRQVGSYT